MFLSVEFTPQREEFIKAVRVFMRKSYEHITWIGAIVYLLLTIAFAWMTLNNSDNSFQLIITFLILGLPPFFLARILNAPVAVDETVIKPTKWLLGDSGITVTLPHLNANFGWDTFSKVMESQDYLYLVHKNKTNFHFLPKRAVTSETDHDLREFLTAKYGTISSTKIAPGPKFMLYLLGALYLVNIGLLLYSNIRAGLG